MLRTIYLSHNTAQAEVQGVKDILTEMMEIMEFGLLDIPADDRPDRVKQLMFEVTKCVQPLLQEYIEIKTGTGRYLDTNFLPPSINHLSDIQKAFGILIERQIAKIDNTDPEKEKKLIDFEKYKLLFTQNVFCLNYLLIERLTDLSDIPEGSWFRSCIGGKFMTIFGNYPMCPISVPNILFMGITGMSNDQNALIVRNNYDHLFQQAITKKGHIKKEKNIQKLRREILQIAGKINTDITFHVYNSDKKEVETKTEPVKLFEN